MTADYNQYKMTVNNSQSKPGGAEVLDRWNEYKDTINERGWEAKLERRLVTDNSMLEFMGDDRDSWKADGWMIFENKNMVISPWETIAEFNPRY